MAAERMRKVTFTGATGAKLDARLDLPSGKPVAWALVAHCFTCSKDLLSLTRLSHALSDHGWAVLRFDFTGIGSSEGEFGNPDFRSNVGDVIAAARHLRDHFAAPTLLLGHSVGGAAVLAAAEQLPEVRAVATLNTPLEPEQAPRLFGGAWENARRNGFAELSIAGRPFRVTAEFFEHLSRERMERAVRELSRPLLVMHGTADALVPVTNGERLFLAAQQPRSFVAVDGGDHLLSRREDAVFVASVVASWASRYAPSVPQPSREPLPEIGHVEVAESGDGPYAQRITLGPHRIRADEPESFGGRDTGPPPYDLLLASLGACTSMTLRMYADRKGWPLEHVSVQLSHRRIHASDCKDCETTVGKIDLLERRLQLEGALDPDQRARLLEIANRCPVHRTLESEVKITTELAEEL